MALVAGCGVALAVALATDRGTSIVHEPSSSPPPRSETTARASADVRTGDAESEEDDAYQPFVDHPAPPEDSISEQWDDLSTNERVRIQRARFDEAIARADAGDEVERNLALARDALTALRPELHASIDGRVEHGRLEARLDALTDADADPPRRKR